MKKLHTFQILMVAIFGLAMMSCNKNDEPTVKDPNSYFSVVKMKQDYTQYAMGIENNNKNFVQPITPLGLENKFLQLNNGYWVTTYGKSLDGREVVTDISLEEYGKLYEEYAETNLDKLRDTLYSRIIDREPFEELYSVSKKDFSIKGGPDIDKINALIESGEFFTYEGVERVK